ncbi:L-serine ammonia-lyase, iron-sulfur-dependent, subunit alpha [Clostridium thermarum]|uniref:L-serine ammonia-lyase, iron-sulfur-dependent, subunit alpha n=1 Tax=Clostridium thermarum TaxID=1716543 RepID=UPI0013D29BBE|nr:L-serine ammonia-lyase, iron-sulfur-dependent, subunit alpha [Clostridium thermarum]
MAVSGEELLRICKTESIPIYEYAVRKEMEAGYNREEVIGKMRRNLEVMKEAADFKRKNILTSVGGLIGSESYRLNKYIDKGNSIVGDTILKAMARAFSCSEVNASMGRIVAAPTAGSCGIIPAALITAAESTGKGDDDIINALFTAGQVGIIIATNATVAGAEGGCQAECGSAAAMAAAALVEMQGGKPETSLQAAGIALQNVMGLICDPIAGLVESPCSKRNASGVINALCSAEMALAGVTSVIPFDEVVEAMYRVGKSLPYELRETALGGIAATPTGEKYKRDIMGS